jgi:hypothetical protein
MDQKGFLLSANRFLALQDTKRHLWTIVAAISFFSISSLTGLAMLFRMLPLTCTGQIVGGIAWTLILAAAAPKLRKMLFAFQDDLRVLKKYQTASSMICFQQVFPFKIRKQMIQYSIFQKILLHLLIKTKKLRDQDDFSQRVLQKGLNPRSVARKFQQFEALHFSQLRESLLGPKRILEIQKNPNLLMETCLELKTVLLSFYKDPELSAFVNGHWLPLPLRLPFEFTSQYLFGMRV